MFEKRTKYMRSIEFCLSLNFFIVTKRTICVTFGGFTTVCLSRAQRQHLWHEILAGVSLFRVRISGQNWVLFYGVASL